MWGRDFAGRTRAKGGIEIELAILSTSARSGIPTARPQCLPLPRVEQDEGVSQDRLRVDLQQLGACLGQLSGRVAEEAEGARQAQESILGAAARAYGKEISLRRQQIGAYHRVGTVYDEAVASSPGGERPSRADWTNKFFRLARLGAVCAPLLPAQTRGRSARRLLRVLRRNVPRVGGEGGSGARHLDEGCEASPSCPLAAPGRDTWQQCEGSKRNDAAGVGGSHGGARGLPGHGLFRRCVRLVAQHCASSRAFGC